MEQSYRGLPIREGAEIPDTSVWFVTWGRTPPRNRWERWARKVGLYKERLHEAWAVLRGNMQAVPWSDD